MSWRVITTSGVHCTHILILHATSAHGLGEVAAAETGFDLTQPGDAAQTVLAADTAFVRSENVPLLDVEGYPRVVPDLVVETASPSQSREGLAGKARAWLGVDGTLDGGEVVP